MMNYYRWHMIRPASPFFGFGWIFGLIFWIFAFLLVVAIIKSFSERENAVEEEEPNRAVEILKERYAKGEITKRDFDRMKKEIA